MYRIIGLLAVVALMALPAAATPIVFSTSMQAGSTIFNNGQVTVTFTGLNAASVEPGPTGSNTSLGYFTVSTNSLVDVVIAPTPFVLQIVSSSPQAASGTMSGIISGTVANNRSNAFATFTTPPTPPSATVGNYLFALYSRNPVALVPPTTNGGVTTIEAQVFQLTPDVNVPEPASYALIGAGLLALAIHRRRRAA